MKKFEIIKNENSVYKNYKEIKKFEVVNMEFGDFDNFINAIILNISIEKEEKYPNNRIRSLYKIDFCYANGMFETAYESSFTPLELKVIGYAKQLETIAEINEIEL